MQRELKEVQAITFKRKKIKEADVFVKLLTKHNGIFTVDVRGALRPKSKLGPATMNFSYGDFIVNTNFQGISTLRTYKNIKQYENIYLDIKKNAYASYILDLIDHAFIEYQDLGNYYDLIYFALNKINDGLDAEIIKQLIELKLLKAYGVNPNFEACVFCGKKNAKFDFSIEYGGLVCSDHFKSVKMRMFLDSKTISLIRTLALIDFKKLGNVNIKNDLKMKSKNVIEKLYINYLDLNLKTKKFLDELNLLDY